MMRVLVVTNMYPTPSAPTTGLVVEQQVRSLRAKGVNVEVLHFDRTRHGQRAYWRLGTRLSNVVKEVRPDLVHVTYGGVMAYLATRAVTDRPVIVYFRGSDLLGSPAEPRLRRFTIYIGVLASRRAAERAAASIVDSENLRAALPERVRSGACIVPSGIDLDQFQPLDRTRCREALGWELDSRQVLFTASPHRPEKRFVLAQAAVEHLRRSGRNVELRVLDGVPHRDVVTWMNASDAVLLTSTHEGSPNAVKEALACNVPVVSVDVGDVRERLAQVPGCYVAAPTPEDVADKLELVLTTGRPIDGRETLASTSLEETADRLIDVYTTTLQRWAEHPAQRPR